MKYGRKMKLVDVEDAFGLQSETISMDKKISKLDKRIENILKIKHLNDDQKVKLYNMELQKFLFFTKQKKKPKELKLVLDDSANFNFNKKTAYKKQPTSKKEEDDALSYSDIANDTDRYSSAEEGEEDDVTPKPKSASMYFDHSKNLNKEISLSPIKVNPKHAPTSSSTPISAYKLQKKDDILKPRNLLSRSPHLTRQLVAQSSNAAEKFKNWISFSKTNKK